MSYDAKEGIYMAEGDVLITKDGQTLSAKIAKYNEKTGIVEVSGGVRLEANGDIIEGERGIFDLNSHQGQIVKGRIFLQTNHYYISGDVMEKTGPYTYRVKNCKVTTCDGAKPDWSVTGGEVEVALEGYGTIRNAALRIRDFPVFYLPFAVFPARSKRQTGLLLPRMGYSNSNGLDIEVPFFWAISDQTDATFYERYMSERGFMQGAELRYLDDSGSKGVLMADVLSDEKERKDLSDPDELQLSHFPRTNKTRYWLRGRADQALPLDVQARLDGDFVSDQDYLKEFRGGLYGFDARPDLGHESHRPLEEIFSPTRRSALRLSRDRESYGLQAITSYHQRPEDPPNDDTSQPLGGMDFSLLPRPLAGTPLFFTLDTQADHVWRDEGVKGNSVSFSPALSYPVWFGRIMEFEPSIGFTSNNQWLDNDQRDIGRQSRNAYRFDGRLSTVLERIFDVDWDNAQRLKHKLFPSLVYTYRSHRDVDKFRPWFEPIDAEGDINRVTLSLENFLDARKEDKKGNVSYRQWGAFSLSQGYDLNEARRDEDPEREKKPFEPLVAILSLMPLPQMDLDAESHWNHEESKIDFTDVSLEWMVDRSGGRRDRYEVDYQYERGGSKSLNYSLDINLFYGLSAGTSLRRDLDQDYTLESGYWLQYQSQCWAVKLIAGELDNASSFFVSVSLLGLGGI